MNVNNPEADHFIGDNRIIFFVSLNAAAMMEGRSSSGARGYSYDFYMGGGTGGGGHGSGFPENGGSHDRGHKQYPHDPGNAYIPGSGMNHSSGNVNREMAEQMIHRHMRKYRSG